MALLETLMRDLENFDSNDAAYNTAKAYTKALNDAFNDLLPVMFKDKSNREGIERPELVGNDIFQSDGAICFKTVGSNWTI